MQSALTQLPGVEKVETSLERGEAVVQVSQKEPPQMAQLLDAIKKAGFTGTLKTTNQ